MPQHHHTPSSLLIQFKEQMLNWCNRNDNICRFFIVVVVVVAVAVFVITIVVVILIIFFTPTASRDLRLQAAL